VTLLKNLFKLPTQYVQFIIICRSIKSLEFGCEEFYHEGVAPVIK
jgi:hypothetical protein